MKGRTSNTMRTNSGCYADGGAVSAAPAAAAPAVARRHGGACEVDGNAAKLSLARPGRKIMKKRADGGGVSRISEDSRREAARLRSEAGDNAIDTVGRGGLSAVGAVGTVLPYGRGNARFRALNAAGSALMGAGALGANHLRGRNSAEANRIERGEADPGREDRKHGGNVKKGKC